MRAIVLCMCIPRHAETLVAFEWRYVIEFQHGKLSQQAIEKKKYLKIKTDFALHPKINTLFWYLGE